jgi:hypothetical protein
MFHRTFWLHYRSLRLVLEVCLIFGAALLCSYWILRT